MPKRKKGNDKQENDSPSPSPPVPKNVRIQTTSHSSEMDTEQSELTPNAASKALVKRTRWIKFFNTLFSIALICILLFVATSTGSSGYHILSYGLIGLYVISAPYFLSMVLGSNQLHYIYVKRKSVHGYQNFIIPYQFIEDPQQTIKSISAMTATFGSNAHGLLSRASYASVGIVFAAIVIHLNDHRNDLSLNDEIACYVMLIGVYGNCLYGTWELEGPRNYLSIFMHYSCAPLIFILQTLAFAIQQQWSPLSIALFSIGIVLDIVYVVILYGLPEKSDNPQTVHRISLACILTEVTALVVPCVATILFIHDL